MEVGKSKISLDAMEKMENQCTTISMSSRGRVLFDTRHSQDGTKVAMNNENERELLIPSAIFNDNGIRVETK